MALTFSARSMPALAQTEQRAEPEALGTAEPREPLPSLASLVRRSYDHAADNQASLAEERRMASEHQSNWTRLLPSLTATAAYTRNQVEAIARVPAPDGSARSAVFTPHDQWDATLQLNVPLIDYSQYRSNASSNAAHRAAHVDVLATRQDVAERVVSAYYTALGGLALQRSTQRGVRVAEQNLSVVSARATSGLASDLDLERARAAVAERQLDVASAELTTLQGLRRLQTLTGWFPQRKLEAVELEESNATDPPLEHWLASATTQAAVVAAGHRLSAAEAQEDATLGRYLPRLDGNLRERFSNAVGFGASPTWSVGATATWQVDLGALGALGAAEAGTAAARAEQLRVQRQIGERIANEWDQVHAELARVRATQAQARAAKAAADVAAARYGAGTSTQLDVLQANRDALNAEVEHISSLVELAKARATLRLVSAGLQRFEAGAAAPDHEGSNR